MKNEIHFTSLRNLTPSQRLKCVLGDRLNDEALALFQKNHPPMALSDSLIENAIGYLSIPIGVAANFKIDGVHRWIPMAIEETSVIASASSTAKWIQQLGGTTTTTCTGVDIIAQIHIPAPQNIEQSTRRIRAAQDQILTLANSAVQSLVRRGGGFSQIKLRELAGKMLVLDLFCNPCDAMGANLVTQAAECVKPFLAKLTGDRMGMAIVSNLTDHRIFKAEVCVPGVPFEVGRNLEEGSAFAEADSHRAATHNKGIFNAIDAILIATGNDWRAAEASAHAFAARTGTYQPISKWRYKENGTLIGHIELAIPCGTVGGVTRIHPVAKACLEILNISGADELGRICAAVGLVQNLAALRSLTGPGLTLGHMSLHSKNLARAAGAKDEEIQFVSDQLRHRLEVGENISESNAVQILKSLREQKLKINE